MTSIRARLFAVFAASLLGAPLASATVHQATGIKIGEVTAESALVWTRLSREPDARADGAKFIESRRREAEAADPLAQLPAGATLEQMEYAVPGAPGEVRVVWAPVDGTAAERATAWQAVDPVADFTRRIALEGLAAGTRYALRVESRDPAGRAGATVAGTFVTPPSAASVAPVRFVVTTCHDDWRRDDGPNGFKAYDAARAWAPDFFVHTGDFIYLDKPAPFGLTPALARFKWNRTNAWPSVREFYRGVSAYFIKDDHDISRNDSAPGDTFGAVSFRQGVEIMDEQLPMPESPPYRSIRWGRDLEIWLLEGREFRNARKREAVADRTLLGPDQKRWLLESLRRSTAAFRVVISGTPIVGPNVDYKGGDSGDSLADEVFQAEGDEMRRALAALPRTFVIAGDRHWQYHSVDPATGLNEFACGPVCFGMAEEFADKVKRHPMHRFLRIDGGFLGGEVSRNAAGLPVLTFRHHDVHGAILYERAFEAAQP